MGGTIANKLERIGLLRTNQVVAAREERYPPNLTATECEGARSASRHLRPVYYGKS